MWLLLFVLCGQVQQLLDKMMVCILWGGLFLCVGVLFVCRFDQCWVIGVVEFWCVLWYFCFVLLKCLSMFVEGVLLSRLKMMMVMLVKRKLGMILYRLVQFNRFFYRIIVVVLMIMLVSVLLWVICFYSRENSISGLKVVLKLVQVQDIRLSMWFFGLEVSQMVIIVISSIMV